METTATHISGVRESKRRVCYHLSEDLVHDLVRLRKARNVNLSRFVEATLRDALRKLDRKRPPTRSNTQS